MDKYVGPFLEEQVENVKVVLQLIPLFICIVGFVCAEDVSYDKADEGFSSLAFLCSKTQYIL